MKRSSHLKRIDDEGLFGRRKADMTEQAKRVANQPPLAEPALPEMQTTVRYAGPYQVIPPEILSDKKKIMAYLRRHLNHADTPLERIAKRLSLRARRSAGSKLQLPFDLSNLNLREMRFDGLDLSGCNFAHSDLGHSSFRSSKLAGANLSHTDLHLVVFENTIAMHANFTESRLSNTLCKSSNFMHADFTGASFWSSAEFTDTIFINAIFKDAHLGNITMVRPNFTGADFTGIERFDYVFIDGIFNNAKIPRKFEDHVPMHQRDVVVWVD